MDFSQFGPMGMMMQMMMGMKGMGKGGAAWGPAAGAKSGGPKKNEKEKKVKVTNVPKGTDWQDLKDHMKDAGTVEFCSDCKHGSAEVRYSSEEEAQNAIASLN